MSLATLLHTGAVVRGRAASSCACRSAGGDAAGSRATRCGVAHGR